MLRIGVTGGIGSGKTFVCHVFEVLGIPVYYADLRTKIIQNFNEEVIEGTKALFGEEAYAAPNQLNREFVAKKVFQDKTKLEALNALIHPKVFEDFDQWCEEYCDSPYILKESALTFETGFNKKLDKVIVVTAPEATRIERVAKRDSFRTEADIRNIIEKQMPESEKVAKADYVLKNDEKSLLLPEIIKLHNLFLGRKFV